MNTVELTREVATKFIETKFPFTSLNQLPLGKEFAIIFPITLGLTEAQLEIVKSMKFEENYTAIFNFETGFNIKCYMGNVLFMDCELKEDTKYEFLYRKASEDMTKALLSTCINVLAGVLYQFAIPVTEKQVDNIRELKSKSKSYVPSSSKKYIYKTRYVFKTIAEPVQKKEINRQTECWSVIGHIRRLRDSNGEVYKEVWVQPYTKGHGTPKDKEYKITRL